MSVACVYTCPFFFFLQTSIVAGTLITAGLDRGRDSLPITEQTRQSVRNWGRGVSQLGNAFGCMNLIKVWVGGNWPGLIWYLFDLFTNQNQSSSSLGSAGRSRLTLHRAETARLSDTSDLMRFARVSNTRWVCQETLVVMRWNSRRVERILIQFASCLLQVVKVTTQAISTLFPVWYKPLKLL